MQSAAFLMGPALGLLWSPASSKCQVCRAGDSSSWFSTSRACSSRCPRSQLCLARAPSAQPAGKTPCGTGCPRGPLGGLQACLSLGPLAEWLLASARGRKRGGRSLEPPELKGMVVLVPPVFSGAFTPVMCTWYE